MQQSEIIGAVQKRVKGKKQFLFSLFFLLRKLFNPFATFYCFAIMNAIRARPEDSGHAILSLSLLLFFLPGALHIFHSLPGEEKDERKYFFIKYLIGTSFVVLRAFYLGRI